MPKEGHPTPIHTVAHFPPVDRGEQNLRDPHVVYEMDAPLPIDDILAQVTCAALREVDLQLELERDVDRRTGKVNKIALRSKSKDHKERHLEGALFVGIIETTRRQLVATEIEHSDLELYREKAAPLATTLTHSLVENEELYSEFRRFYGGMVLSSDWQRFATVLFQQSATFDKDLIATHAVSRHINELSHHLNLPYEQYREWYRLSPEEVFAVAPEVDYRRLDDEEFRNSPEGQKLEKAYAKVCGSILADRHKTVEWLVTAEGDEIQKPAVPLSHFPVVETLMGHEAGITHPRPKYFFGPSDVADYIIKTDSEYVHNALVGALCQRVVPDLRQQMDGLRELEHKGRLIQDILQTYSREPYDSGLKALLRKDILTIMDQYTHHGGLADSVRGEEIALIISFGSDRYSWNITDMKRVVGEILKVTLVAPDPELRFSAERIVDLFLERPGDLLSLSRAELISLVFDAIDNASSRSQIDVIERVAVKVFGNEADGRRIAALCELGVESEKLRRSKDVLQAFVVWRRTDRNIDDKSPETVAAREAYGIAQKPTHELQERLRMEKNQALIELVSNALRLRTEPEAANEVSRLVESLVSKIKFGLYKEHELPQEYHVLLALAQQDYVSDQIKSKIVWQFFKEFQYTDPDRQYLLVPVVLEIYKTMLGEPDDLRVPGSETSHGLAAATALVRERRGLLKSATHTELLRLASYGEAMRKLAERMALDDRALPPPEKRKNPFAIRKAEISTEATPLRDLENVARELETIRQYYESYLHIERVKVEPKTYYPWMLRQLLPFWRKLQWEVGPGNEPSAKMRRLYRTFEELLRTRVVIREGDEYPEGFDCITEGHVDELLKAGYDDMLRHHDMLYNQTCWIEGTGFVRSAIMYMPKQLADQIIEKHKGTEFGEYFRKEHERWTKEETVR